MGTVLDGPGCERGELMDVDCFAADDSDHPPTDIDMAPSTAPTSPGIDAGPPKAATPAVRDPWSGFPLICQTILSYLPHHDLLGMRRVSRNFCTLANDMLTSHLVLSEDNKYGDIVISGYTARPFGLMGDPCGLSKNYLYGFDAVAARSMANCRLLDIHRPVEEVEQFLFRTCSKPLTLRNLYPGWMVGDDDESRFHADIHKYRATFPFETLDHLDMSLYKDHLPKVNVLRLVIDAAYPVLTVPLYIRTPARLIIFTPTAMVDDPDMPALTIPSIVPPPGVSRLTINMRYFMEKPWQRRPVAKDKDTIFLPDSLRELVVLFSPLDYRLSKPREPPHDPPLNPFSAAALTQPTGDPHTGELLRWPQFVVKLLATVVRHNLTRPHPVVCTVVGMDWANDALWSVSRADVPGWMVEAVEAELIKVNSKSPPRDLVRAEEIWGAPTDRKHSMLEVHRSAVADANYRWLAQNGTMMQESNSGGARRGVPAAFRPPPPPPPPRAPALNAAAVTDEVAKIKFVSRRIYRASVGFTVYDLETKVDISAVPAESAGAGGTAGAGARFP
ncbi:hypothetical protein Q8F55_003002 [Vanrija albida]|uniref:F-box domain-containing protein n=1 Tax=Vanrija albida TaxID=181172 RepID=A0ABR3QBW9_9TREE